MIRRFLSVSASILALSALSGCDQNSPLATSEESPVSRPSAVSSGPRMVPWKESYEASGTITPDEVRCPEELLVSLAGGGKATHVGRYTIINSHCVNPGTGALTDGRFVKTAANGDQISGTYTGNSEIIQPPEPIGIFKVTGNLRFTSGTGRFAGVTGTAKMNGSLRSDFSQDEVPTQVTLVMIGSISSPGSSKH